MMVASKATMVTVIATPDNDTNKSRLLRGMSGSLGLADSVTAILENTES
jgi:hypothetical protein